MKKQVFRIIIIGMAAVCIWGCRAENESGQGAYAEQVVRPAGVTESMPEPETSVQPDMQPVSEPQGYPDYFTELSGCYYFDQLSEAEKYWYVDMYLTLLAHGTEGELCPEQNGAIAIASIDWIFNCVLNDHPEIFYVSGYNYTLQTSGDGTDSVIFSGAYTMDAAEAALRREQIDLYVAECLTGISMEASEYEKVKYVYEYLITNTEYNLEAPQNQNVCSVFIGKESVCQGYAKAMQYLLERLGVRCTLVIGTVDGEGHAWNLVQIGGEYYYVDATWGDASYQVVEDGEVVNEGSVPAINYDYLCVTTEQLTQTHTLNPEVPMPECTAMAANYYVMEGAYFAGYDEEQLSALFQRGYEQGRSDVTLKCANYEAYHAIFEKLITSQQIFRFLDAPDGIIAYANNDDQLSLTFWLVQEE